MRSTWDWTHVRCLPFSCTAYQEAPSTLGQLTTTESAWICPAVTAGPPEGFLVGVGEGFLVGVGEGFGPGSVPPPPPLLFIRNWLSAMFQCVAR